MNSTFPEMPPPSDVAVKEEPADIKDRINALLHYSLPDSTTLLRVEQIACHFYEVIFSEWSKPRPASGEAR